MDIREVQEMKRREMRSNEMSDKAFEVYSNSDFVVWQDGLDYFVSDTERSEKFFVGNLRSVTEFFESFVEEELDNEI